jgi:hypothetical protein
MLSHPYISVARNDYLDEDIPDDEGIPDFIDEGIPDFLDEDSPACPIPSQPSRFPSSSPRPGPVNQSYASPQNSMPPRLRTHTFRIILDKFRYIYINLDRCI